MTVYTVDKHGNPGMPTFNIKKIRRLLKEGKAKIFRHHPFTVQLLYADHLDVQETELCMDSGYSHIGLSVKSEKHEYTHAQYDLLPDEKQRHDDRRRYRRARRSRLRYRKPRFDNRKKDGGWLAPSIQNKLDRHIDLVRRYMEVCPVTSITVETASFDTQLLEALETGAKIPEGKDYQKGRRYQMETLRSAVFYRDSYTCLLCGEKGKVYRVHHIGYWKGDHTDRMGNLATLCVKCHTAKNHQKGNPLYGWEPKLKPLTGAAFMNIMRWKLVEFLKQFGIPLHVTYGAMTKVSRGMANIEKTHANDAYCMGKFRPKHRARQKIYKKRRRNNRVLEKFYDAKIIDIRDGKTKKGADLSCGRTSRSMPRSNDRNERKCRGRKVSKGCRSIRRRRYQIQPGTKLLYENKKYTANGVHCNGLRVILEENKKSVAVTRVNILYKEGGWQEVSASG